MPASFATSRYLEALGGRAIWHSFLGELDEAVEYADRGVRFAEALGVPRATAYASNCRGLISLTKGDFAAACPLFSQTLEISEKEGMRHSTIGSAILLGATLAQLGRIEEGINYSLRGIALIDAMNLDMWIWHAHTLLLAGRGAEACKVADRLLPLVQACGARGTEGRALLLLCMASNATGNLEAATSYGAKGLTLSQELGARHLAAHCHHLLGQLDAKAGNRDNARKQLVTAVTMYRDMGMSSFLERTEAELALVRKEF